MRVRKLSGPSPRAIVRLSSHQPRRALEQAGSELADGESLDEHRTSVLASVLLTKVDHGPSHGQPGGHSGSRPVSPFGSCPRAVLGRLLGRTAAAATTPTAVQSLRRLLG